MDRATVILKHGLGFFIDIVQRTFYSTVSLLLLAECLLLGSKQRIHVTLFNGPGFICESSVIQMSSSTGLEFSPVAPSSVMVYSTNKKEEPREGAMHIELSGTKRNEAYMYLPKCGPYEKADLYFDAYAPVENVDLFEHMMKHEVCCFCFVSSEKCAMLPLKKTRLISFYSNFVVLLSVSSMIVSDKMPRSFCGNNHIHSKILIVSIADVPCGI